MSREPLPTLCEFWQSREGIEIQELQSACIVTTLTNAKEMDLVPQEHILGRILTSSWRLEVSSPPHFPFGAFIEVIIT